MGSWPSWSASIWNPILTLYSGFLLKQTTGGNNKGSNSQVLATHTEDLYQVVRTWFQTEPASGSSHSFLSVWDFLCLFKLEIFFFPLMFSNKMISLPSLSQPLFPPYTHHSIRSHWPWYQVPVDKRSLSLGFTLGEKMTCSPWSQVIELRAR